MADYTLTYSEGSKGFPSFYSYYPDYMIGMNNYFYTFKGGQMYRHNTNDTHNRYYETTYSSIIKTVINQSPLENKLFKTINLESTDAWTADILTDINSQLGKIPSDEFVKKEGNYFGYVRNQGVSNTSAAISSSELNSRTIGGLGVPFQQNAGNMRFYLSSTPLSIGDYIYRYDNFSDSLVFVGKVTDTYYYTDAFNRKVLTVVHNGTTTPFGAFISFAKDTAAESMGVMGHYAEVTLTLPSTVTGPSELFAIESETMKSYP